MTRINTRREAAMAQGYVRPLYNPEQVNAAGKAIRAFMASTEERPPMSPELSHAIDVVDNFRAAHQFPLNTLYMTLKNRAGRVSPALIPSMRLKRFSSIAVKLHDRTRMKMTQMQDIGGCRVVLPTLEDVYALRDKYMARGSQDHELSGDEFEKDYIDNPKRDGYRSLHLKYKFRGTDKSKIYDGLRIEVQIRTALQHRWAMAVEAAGTFKRMALKSGRGDPNWLRFFALMGSVFAGREGTASVPGTPETSKEIQAEIRQLNERHYIERTFSEMRTLLPRIEKQKGMKYFVIVLDPRSSELQVEGFGKGEFVKANAYLTAEEARVGRDSPVQVVLVSVAKVSDLKRAYPSYFLDTDAFLWDVRELTG